MDKKNINLARQARESRAGTLTHVIGRTTYSIGIHFNEKSKETYEDVARRLILKELTQDSQSI